MILVTGGLGHIGRATVQALLDIGEECVLVQRRPPDVAEGLFTRAVSAHRVDVRDLDALRAVGRRHAVTGIVHLAGSMPWPPDPGEARWPPPGVRSTGCSTSCRSPTSGASGA